MDKLVIKGKDYKKDKINKFSEDLIEVDNNKEKDDKRCTFKINCKYKLDNRYNLSKI